MTDEEKYDFHLELMTKMKMANQNIDVHYYQGRVPGEWFARVVMSSKETFTVGPGSIRSVLAGVGNLIVLEAQHADVRVHGTTTHEVTQPRKMSDLKEYRRLAKETD